MEEKEKTIVVDSQTYQVVERNKGTDVDQGIKNKWRWCWLEEKDLSVDSDFLSD